MSSQGLLGFPKGEVKAVSGTSTNPGFGAFAFPRGGGSASRIRTYQDNFTSSGASLGLFTDGTLTWQNVGSGNGWSNQGGNSYNTATTRQTFTWIDFNKSDVTITANANQLGFGRGIVFRQSDSDNYWLFSQESQYELAGYTAFSCIGVPGDWGPWAFTTGSWTVLYREPCSAYNYYCCGYIHGERQYRFDTGQQESRSRFWSYYDSTVPYYARRDYVTLYKIQNGSPTAVYRRNIGFQTWPYNTWLRVQTSGSTITLFSSASGNANNLEAAVTDSFNQSATRHGMGRDAWSGSTYQGSFFWDSIVFVG